MTKEEFEKLKVGDKVLHAFGSIGIVTEKDECGYVVKDKGFDAGDGMDEVSFAWNEGHIVNSKVMAQYIDKSTLLKEIEKLKCNLCPDFYEYNYDAAKVELLEKIENFINTLKVKDVDLEKEVENWVKTGPHTSYPWCTIPDAIRITAEHFFELGFKAAQKGEEI
jgi:hypothetical protein